MKTCAVCGKQNQDHLASCQFCGTQLPTAIRELKIPKIEPGNVLAGRYRILTEVGKGGMGFVYAAEEESLGIKRNVAIKILPPQLMMDEGLAARFREEIKIAAGLDHPNIVPIYSLGEHYGVYFYVMKLLDGQTAYQRLKQYGPLDEKELRRILALIARALHYAHGKGVIHRDVKSNNIHLGIDDMVMLMDFGIARSADSSEITLPGQIVGTAEYMAPEQWYGEADPKSDIYSLGIVCYELITGRVPFKSKNTFELMKMHQEMEPELPRSLNGAISEHLQAIILKCLAKEPVDRFATAMDLAKELETLPAVSEASAKTTIIQAKYIAQAEEAPVKLRTEIMAKPPEELSENDQKAWTLCQKADDCYSLGDLDKAIELINKAHKLAAERPDVITRKKKFENLKSLINRTLERANKALDDGRPQSAAADYEQILQSYPIPAVAAKLKTAQDRVEKAKLLYNRARLMESRGKVRAALRLIKKVEKIDSEAGDLETRRYLLAGKKKTKHGITGIKRRPISKSTVALVLFFLILIGLIFGGRPALLYLADYTYRQGDPTMLFEAPYSSLQLYEYAKLLQSKDPIIEERIKEITEKAKNHYIALGDQSLKGNDLVSAIKWYEKALEHDPFDVKLRDLVELLKAKYAVKKSLNTL